jgi:hypothetical protein
MDLARAADRTSGNADLELAVDVGHGLRAP